ncbi:MAG: hypothetical protein FJY67_00885 [Calditrichaeota bacterium]|nr:hypothetical protein [Calditrichota bacterium]
MDDSDRPPRHDLEGEAVPETTEIPWETMLAYVPVFCLYTWSQSREKPELREHARQGMILFAVEVVLFLVTVPTFYKILWLAVLVMAVLGIWAAFNGRPFRLPLLGDLADRLSGDPAGGEDREV